MKGRKPNDSYVDAAITVIRSSGESSMRVGDLYSKALEEGLLNGDQKWAYHNFGRAIRNSPIFDCSKRGWVSLMTTTSNSVGDAAIEEFGEIIGKCSIGISNEDN